MLAVSGYAQSPPSVGPDAYSHARQGIYSIMDYGAVGDGSTDDRAAIQAALDAGAGATVLVPKGIFLIDITSSDNPTDTILGYLGAALRIHSNTTLLGVGRGSEIRQSNDMLGVTIMNSDTTNGDSNIVYDGIFFNCTNQLLHYDSVIARIEDERGQPFGAAISFQRATHSAIRNCFIANTTRDGVGVGRSANMSFTNNMLWNIGEDGFTMVEGERDETPPLFTGEHGPVIFDGNILHGKDSTWLGTGDVGGSAWISAGGSAFVIKASNVIVSNNRVRWFNVGVDIFHEGPDSLKNIVVSGNVFQEQMSRGMSIFGAYDVTVTGNTFVDIHGNGVQVGSHDWDEVIYSSSRINITGNTFRRFFPAPIAPDNGTALYVHTGNNILFANNIVDSMSHNGIYIRAWDANTNANGSEDGNIIVEGNQILNSKYDGIKTDSTYRMTIRGNHIFKNGGDGIDVLSNSGWPHVAAWVNDEDSTDNLIITGNLVQENDEDGIYLAGINQSIISNNLIINNNQDGSAIEEGLLLSNCQDNQVTGNVIIGAHDIGLRLIGETFRNIISNNYVAGAGVDMRTDTAFWIFGWSGDTLFTDTNACTPDCTDSVTFDTLRGNLMDSNFVFGNKIGTGKVIADSVPMSKYYIDNAPWGGYILPGTDGDADQMLKTDGSLQLSWATPPGAGSGDDAFIDSVGDGSNTVDMGKLVLQTTGTIKWTVDGDTAMADVIDPHTLDSAEVMTILRDSTYVDSALVGAIISDSVTSISSLDSAEVMTLLRDTTYVDSALVGAIINDSVGAVASLWDVGGTDDTVSVDGTSDEIIRFARDATNDTTKGVVDGVLVFEADAGLSILGDSSILGIPAYLGAQEADSLLPTAYTVKALIEDSLNEYSLTSALFDTAAVVDTIQGMTFATGQITDQTIVTADIDTTSSNFVFDDAYRGTSAESDSAYTTQGELGDSATAIRGDFPAALSNQAVKGDHVDSTAENFVFSDAFRVTSAESDSAYMTKDYIDDAGGLWDMTTTMDTVSLSGSADTALKITRDATNDTTKVTVPEGVIVFGGAGLTTIKDSVVIPAGKGWLGVVSEGDSALVSKKYVDDAAGGLVEQSVKGDHVDSVGENFVFDDAYKVTSAESDSLLSTEYTVKVLIEDSLNEYSLSSALFDTAAVVDTIQGMSFATGQITDQTITTADIDTTASDLVCYPPSTP